MLTRMQKIALKTALREAGIRRARAAAAASKTKRPAASKAKRQGVKAPAPATTLPAARSLSSNIERDLAAIPRHSVRLALEIGCFHGETTNLICDGWLVPGEGRIVAVDPLVDGQYVPVEEDADEALRRKHRDVWSSSFSKQFDIFRRNVARNQHRVELMRTTSDAAYPSLRATNEGAFDLIYIDGDHRSEAVWHDAVNCFALCKIGGHILFDDYHWGEKRFDPSLTPKPAVDRFLREYKGRVRLVSSGRRVLVLKISE